MYTSPSRDPDLLVRTSGEVRLSDFLLWQVHVVKILKFIYNDDPSTHDVTYMKERAQIYKSFS